MWLLLLWLLLLLLLLLRVLKAHLLVLLENALLLLLARVRYQINERPKSNHVYLHTQLGLLLCLEGGLALLFRNVKLERLFLSLLLL